MALKLVQGRSAIEVYADLNGNIKSWIRNSVTPYQLYAQLLISSGDIKGRVSARIPEKYEECIRELVAQYAGKDDKASKEKLVEAITSLFFKGSRTFEEYCTGIVDPPLFILPREVPRCPEGRLKEYTLKVVIDDKGKKRRIEARVVCNPDLERK